MMIRNKNDERSAARKLNSSSEGLVQQKLNFND